MEQEKLKEEIKEELKKEMKSEIKKQSNKKGNNSFVALLVAIIVLLAGYIIYTDFIAKPEPKSDKIEESTETKEEQQAPIEITDNIKNEIKNILGITKWINDGLPSSEFYTIILEDSGVINSLPKEKKQALVTEYIIMNGLYQKVDYTEYSWCAGKGTCEGISAEHFKKAASKFGITDTYDNFFAGYQKYNNLYLLNNGGYMRGDKISHNLIFKSVGSNIEVVDSYVMTSYEGDITKNATKTYTFKKNESGYYLYSMK